jgi:hypothetical protein
MGYAGQLGFQTRVHVPKYLGKYFSLPWVLASSESHRENPLRDATSTLATHNIFVHS